MLRKILAILLLLIITTNICFSQNKTLSNPEWAKQILVEAMSEKNPDKRKEAVIALSLAGNQKDLFPLLTQALSDSDILVRIAACSTLSELKEKQSIPLLEKTLEDPVPEVSFAAAQALWQMSSPTGKEVLLAVLAGEQKTSSGYFAKQKRDTMRMMKTPSALFKFIARTGIGFIPLPGLETGFTSMTELSKNSQLSGQALAALLLAKDNDSISLELLREALLDKDWPVRAAAVHSLAIRNQAFMKDDLVRLFADKKEAVRYRAAAAYLKLDKSKKRK